ncbi:MAG: HAMP domain-containing sensor histidine kinase [Lachnospiraceae bacterium]|nr:HAMP domain-containing sensor histidine kinase [Lachnospiraceae bacterium]
MKSRWFMMALALTLILETACCFLLLGKMERVRQDPVQVNECLHAVEDNWSNEAAYVNTLPFALLDTDGVLLYRNAESISSSINEAIQNNDLILDVVVEDVTVGKMIIHNETAERINGYRTRILWIVCGVGALQLLLVLAFYFYLKKRIIRPFQKLGDFAVRVADGNLDLPLTMDRRHIFGSFTEAFDLMRGELKKARFAEKKANDDKKEMVAKLSHDIKTPVASIKSTAEFGYEAAADERTKEMFRRINTKSDQLTTLVGNLFTSSVQDITEIDVNSGNYPSDILPALIQHADYLGKANQVSVPDCRIFADKLRLQQSFDNIFMNSYKYAGTEITVDVRLEEAYLVIKITDCGEGVKPEELPLLKEKYKRGSNTKEKEGAGLGLYLTDYFLVKMDGKLVLQNAEPGFAAVIYLRRI